MRPEGEFPDGGGWIEHSDIVIRDLTGEHSRIVLRSRPFSGDNVEVVASPDGRHIAFQRSNSPLSEPAGGIAVFVVRTDGTHLRRITPWYLHAGDHPDWSPNGTGLTYAQTGDNDQPDIFTARADGSHARQITHTPLWESAPDWGPAT